MRLAEFSESENKRTRTFATVRRQYSKYAISEAHKSQHRKRNQLNKKYGDSEKTFQIDDVRKFFFSLQIDKTCIHKNITSDIF